MTNEANNLSEASETNGFGNASSASSVSAVQEVGNESAQDSKADKDAQDGTDNPLPQLSAGQLIKQARLQAGLHIAVLAVSLKVPVKRLEALEDDNLTQLPDMVFVRALASSVCNSLKIDPEPVLALMPKASAPRLSNEHQSIDAPLRSALSNDKINPIDVIKTPWVIGGAVLLLAAAAIYWWPTSKSDNAKNVQEPISTAFAAKSTSAAKESNSIEVTPVVATPVTASNTNAMSSSSDKGTSVDLVVFKASGDTWVNVKDAKGAPVFTKLMRAGENVSVNGELPLSVTVGSTNFTQVLVRGQVKDLSQIAKNDVAFFEVK